MAGTVSVVVGGQFGSEAKGAVAGYLADIRRNLGPVIGVRVGGPNAGHTVYGRCPQGCLGGDGHDLGHPWRLRQVPVSAVTNPDSYLAIAAGSEVDFTVLRDEVNQLNSAGYRVRERLYVDGNATVLTSKHIEQEIANSLSGRIGSTAKGIGAARADRIWRTASRVRDHLTSGVVGQVIDTSRLIMAHLNSFNDVHVVIEGTQGFGLGLHTEFYPQCTSGDCRAVDFLAQAGVSPWTESVQKLDVWVVARTYPIRVAGNSGPLAGETSWDALGLPVEKTTVTKKVRRVGEWDPGLVRQAVRANGGPSSNVRLALTMVDYKIPEIKGAKRFVALDEDTRKKLVRLVREVEIDTMARVALVGTGPTSIIDLRTPSA